LQPSPANLQETGSALIMLPTATFLMRLIAFEHSGQLWPVCEQRLHAR
jgi:hypothetical protein